MADLALNYLTPRDNIAVRYASSLLVPEMFPRSFRLTVRVLGS